MADILQKRVEIIKDFNNDIDNFLEFLKLLAPPNLGHKIHQIEMFKAANKLGPIQYYTIYVAPYKKYIERGDVAYFLENDIVTSLNDVRANDFRILEEILKSIWVGLLEEHKKECIDHLQLLTESSIFYVQNLISEGTTSLSYEVVNKIIDLDLVSIKNKHALMTLVTDKRLSEAYDFINNLLLVLSN